MKYKNLFLFVAVIGEIALLSSCSKTVVQPDVVLPTNFSTEIIVEEGEVNVSAAANGANFYTSAFFEAGDTVVIESTNGEATYTYAESGTYTIRSRAHTLATEFVEINDVVEVVVDPGWTGGIPTTGYTTPMTYPGYTLAWNDEFDGSSLSSDWSYDIGTGSSGWGNNELQYYRSENASVGDGLLVITAKQESFGGNAYTSSRIKTQGKQSFEKGRIDIRAALPYGQGIWPALWMLGENFTSVGWPNCGEIDIMELVGGEGYNDRTVHGTVHWDNDGAYASFSGSNTLLSSKFAEEFHVFSIIWDENDIRWLRDDIQYHSIDITPAAMNEFHDDFFFIFNIAVGGNWPGSPNETTVFPQTMAIDYVRVFQ